jgi:hypothetical protein
MWAFLFVLTCLYSLVFTFFFLRFPRVTGLTKITSLLSGLIGPTHRSCDLPFIDIAEQYSFE